MSTDQSAVKRLFMLLHGMYGNQLLDKFRTGKLNERKEDMGILSAQAVWLNDLQYFSFDVIRLAVEKCKERHPTYAPTLPEFLALCKASAPRDYVRPANLQVGMSQELRDKQRAENRAKLAEMKLNAAERVDYGKGLPALLTMISKAVGSAGGDEVKTLMSLESTYMRRA